MAVALRRRQAAPGWAMGDGQMALVVCSTGAVNAFGVVGLAPGRVSPGHQTLPVEKLGQPTSIRQAKSVTLAVHSKGAIDLASTWTAPCRSHQGRSTPVNGRKEPRGDHSVMTGTGERCTTFSVTCSSKRRRQPFLP